VREAFRGENLLRWRVKGGSDSFQEFKKAGGGGGGEGHKGNNPPIARRRRGYGLHFKDFEQTIGEGV